MKMKTMMSTLMTKTMHKFILTLLLGALILPVSVSAHETRMYEINGVEYEMVIGSLNEPVIVDDKTGVSLEIVRDGAFLVGAQDMLQVEMISGDASKIENFSPVYGYEGQYKTTFIATVPTTLTYRIFGTLEGAPVDLTFTCNPAGHPRAEEDTTRTEISEGVFQTLKRGAFGCPAPKEDYGFPASAPSSYTIGSEVEDLQMNMEDDMQSTADRLIIVAILLSLIALGTAVLAYSRRK